MTKTCNYCGFINHEMSNSCTRCGTYFTSHTRSMPMVARRNDLELVQCGNCAKPFNVVNPRKNQTVLSVSSRNKHMFNTVDTDSGEQSVTCPHCRWSQIITWIWG